MGNTIDSQIDPRFGRCSYFVIVDSETMSYEAIPNIALEASGGAGVQAAQAIANKGAKVLITGNLGPNAFQTLRAAGIETIVGASGTVKEAVERYVRGELNRAEAPNVRSHFGMGMGRGRGRQRW
jgi:predicted Fe-Mo cluster-binding NifX family protein